MADKARKTLVTAVFSLLLAGVLAPAALGSAQSVIRDCSEDGTLNGNYSQGDLTNALEQLPSDLDEYTDCRAVIRSAQLGSAGAKHRKARAAGIVGKVNTGAPPSTDEERRIAEAVGSGGSVKIGGTGVRPGVSGQPFKAAGLGTDLPTMLLLVVIGLGAGMLAAGGLAIHRHRPALARGDGPRLPAPLKRLVSGIRNGISRFRR